MAAPFCFGVFHPGLASDGSVQAGGIGSVKFEADGSVRPSSELGVETLRGVTLLCATKDVAEACRNALAAVKAAEDEVVEVSDGEAEVVVVSGGAKDDKLAAQLERLVVVPLPVLGLSGNVVWEVTVGGDGCALFAGVASSKADAVCVVNKFHDKVKELWGEEGGEEEEGEGGGGEHTIMEVQGEDEGECSACGTGWILARHQLLTAVPPA
jgi:hypothetical protein